MTTIGKKFPAFQLKAVNGTDPKTSVSVATNATYAGKWKVFLFWPKDFTFVCPTEIVGFGEIAREFEDRDAVLLGASTDSEFVHMAWRKHHPDLTNSPFAWLSDLNKDLSSALGILVEGEGVPLRATYIVDPDDVIRFVYITDLSVGRNPKEVLRVLDALQTDELCPCNWEKGKDTIQL